MHLLGAIFARGLIYIWCSCELLQQQDSIMYVGFIQNKLQSSFIHVFLEQQWSSMVQISMGYIRPYQAIVIRIHWVFVLLFSWDLPPVRKILNFIFKDTSMPILYHSVTMKLNYFLSYLHRQMVAGKMLRLLRQWHRPQKDPGAFIRILPTEHIHLYASSTKKHGLTLLFTVLNKGILCPTVWRGTVKS